MRGMKSNCNLLTLLDLVVKRLMTGTLEVNPYTQQGRRGDTGLSVAGIPALLNTTQPPGKGNRQQRFGYLSVT
jgi:hypothetical protein